MQIMKLLVPLFIASVVAYGADVQIANAKRWPLTKRTSIHSSQLIDDFSDKNRSAGLAEEYHSAKRWSTDEGIGSNDNCQQRQVSPSDRK
jgi:hypothetical protein